MCVRVEWGKVVCRLNSAGGRGHARARPLVFEQEPVGSLWPLPTSAVPNWGESVRPHRRPLAVSAQQGHRLPAGCLKYHFYSWMSELDRTKPKRNHFSKTEN